MTTTQTETTTDPYMLTTDFLRRFLAQGSGDDELDRMIRDELARRDGES